MSRRRMNTIQNKLTKNLFRSVLRIQLKISTGRTKKILVVVANFCDQTTISFQWKLYTENPSEILINIQKPLFLVETTENP